MPVPRRRHCPSRRDRGRNHFKLEASQSIKCEKCGADTLPHRVCPDCGTYRGRVYKVVVTK